MKKVLFSDINREIKKEKRKVTRNNRNIQSISHFPFFFLPDHRMKNKLFTAFWVGLFYKKTEQSVGESNPCFRRERAAS